MEDVFFNHIFFYITDETFHRCNLCLLCKQKNLSQRQKKINIFHSSENLNKRFLENEIKNVSYIFLDDYHQFMKYIVSILFRETDIEFYKDIIKYERNRIFVDKYVMSNTISEFDENNKLININCDTCQEFVEDVYICSTYRLGVIKKQQVLENCPLAKALIY